MHALCRSAPMSAPRRPPRRRVDGVLLLDKPTGSDVELGAPAREAAVSRREGRAHGHARSAGFGPAAAVLRRGDQVRAVPARRPEALHGDVPLRRHDDDRRCRRRACSRRGRWRSTRGDLEAALRRFVGQDRAGAARLLGAQVRGPRVLRVRARRAATSRASRATSRSTRCAARLDGAGRRRRRRVQQGDVRPRARRGHRRGARLRRAPRRAAADGDRRLRPRRRGDARAPGGHDRRRAAPARLRRRRPSSPACPRIRSARSRPQRFRQGQALPATGRPDGDCAVFADGRVPGHRRRSPPASRGRAGSWSSGCPPKREPVDRKADFRLIMYRLCKRATQRNEKDPKRWPSRFTTRRR